MRGTAGVRTARMAMRRVYAYKQIVLNPTTIGPIVIPGASGDFLGAYNFQLNQVGGNVGPFVSLYDQYKIKKIVWTMYPKYNSSDITQTVAGTTGGELPMIATCIDYDDSNTPANFGEVIQRQNAVIHRGGKPITRTFRPSVNIVADAAAGGLMTKTSPWLDVSNINIPHYGLKLAVQGSSLDQNYEIVVKYYLAFKQVR